ncbi:MAG: hypothetical protein R2849_22255 [Thermomicrobiales bacterium]
MVFITQIPGTWGRTAISVSALFWLCAVVALVLVLNTARSRDSDEEDNT